VAPEPCRQEIPACMSSTWPAPDTPHSLAEKFGATQAELFQNAWQQLSSIRPSKASADCPLLAPILLTYQRGTPENSPGYSSDSA
jgi:hypothetical protein